MSAGGWERCRRSRRGWGGEADGARDDEEGEEAVGVGTGAGAGREMREWRWMRSRGQCLGARG